MIETTKSGLHILFEQGDRVVPEKFEVDKGKVCNVMTAFSVTPIIEDEKFPSKKDTSELQGPELAAFLTTKAIDLDPDITLEEILQYVSTYLIKLKIENFKANEREQVIHTNLVEKQSELSKERIAEIRSIAAAKITEAEAVLEAKAKAAQAAEELAALEAKTTEVTK